MSQATFRSFTLSSFLLTLHRIVKVPQVRLLKLWLLLLCGVLHLPFKYRRKSPVPSGNIMNSQRLYYVHTESKSSILIQDKSFVSTKYYNHVLWLNLTVLSYNYVMSNWSEYFKYVMHTCSLLMSFLCNVIFNVTYKMSTYICVWTNSSTEYNLHYLPRVWSRLWGASLPLLCLLLLFLPASHGETAIMHYGHFGGLTISCKRTELILMESQHLGYSTDADCRPMGQCAVPYPLAKWYCRGRSKCGGMQVERRPLSKRTCGSDFTNCLRVEYQCIPKKSLTNVCSDKQYTQTLGYLSSPSFPEMYPANMNCTCTLSAAPSSQVKLDSPFFLLKAGTPCQDWVQITTETGQATKCGYIPEQRPVVGQHLTVNFHSDKRNTEMGFWFKFSGSGRQPVTLRCGKHVLKDTHLTEEISTVSFYKRKHTSPHPTSTRQQMRESPSSNPKFRTKQTRQSASSNYIRKQTIPSPRSRMRQSTAMQSPRTRMRQSTAMQSPRTRMRQSTAEFSHSPGDTKYSKPAYKMSTPNQNTQFKPDFSDLNGKKAHRSASRTFKNNAGRTFQNTYRLQSTMSNQERHQRHQLKGRHKYGPSTSHPGREILMTTRYSGSQPSLSRSPVHDSLSSRNQDEIWRKPTVSRYNVKIQDNFQEQSSPKYDKSPKLHSRYSADEIITSPLPPSSRKTLREGVHPPRDMRPQTIDKPVHTTKWKPKVHGVTATPQPITLPEVIENHARYMNPFPGTSQPPTLDYHLREEIYGYQPNNQTNGRKKLNNRRYHATHTILDRNNGNRRKTAKDKEKNHNRKGSSSRNFSGRGKVVQSYPDKRKKMNHIDEKVVNNYFVPIVNTDRKPSSGVIINKHNGTGTNTDNLPDVRRNTNNGEQRKEHPQTKPKVDYNGRRKSSNQFAPGRVIIHNTDATLDKLSKARAARKKYFVIENKKVGKKKYILPLPKQRTEMTFDKGVTPAAPINPVLSLVNKTKLQEGVFVQHTTPSLSMSDSISTDKPQLPKPGMEDPHVNAWKPRGPPSYITEVHKQKLQNGYQATSKPTIPPGEDTKYFTDSRIVDTSIATTPKVESGKAVIDSSIKRKDGSRIIITDVRWEDHGDAKFVNSNVAELLFPGVITTQPTRIIPTVGPPVKDSLITEHYHSKHDKASANEDHQLEVSSSSTERNENNVKAYTPLTGQNANMVLYENESQDERSPLLEAEIKDKSGSNYLAETKSKKKPESSLKHRHENKIKDKSSNLFALNGKDSYGNDLNLEEHEPKVISKPLVPGRPNSLISNQYIKGRPKKQHINRESAEEYIIPNQNNYEDRKLDTGIYGGNYKTETKRKDTFIPNETYGHPKPHIPRAPHENHPEVRGHATFEHHDPHAGRVIPSGAILLQETGDLPPAHREMDSQPFQTRLATYAPHHEPAEIKDYTEDIQRVKSWGLVPSKPHPDRKQKVWGHANKAAIYRYHTNPGHSHYGWNQPGLQQGYSQPNKLGPGGRSMHHRQSAVTHPGTWEQGSSKNRIRSNESPVFEETGSTGQLTNINRDDTKIDKNSANDVIAKTKKQTSANRNTLVKVDGQRHKDQLRKAASNSPSFHGSKVHHKSSGGTPHLSAVDKKEYVSRYFNKIQNKLSKSHGQEQQNRKNHHPPLRNSYGKNDIAVPYDSLPSNPGKAKAQDSMDHEIESIIPFGRPSFATGHFHPAPDFISLIEVTKRAPASNTIAPPTLTMPPTTRAPEIVTLLGSFVNKGVLLATKDKAQEIIVKPAGTETPTKGAATPTPNMRNITPAIKTKTLTSTAQMKPPRRRNNRKRQRKKDTTPKPNKINTTPKPLKPVVPFTTKEGVVNVYRGGGQWNQQKSGIASWNKIGQHYGYGFPRLPVNHVTKLVPQVTEQHAVLDQITKGGITVASASEAAGQAGVEVTTTSGQATEKGLSSDMIWVLVVIAAIGWIIFMALLGMVIYNRRNRLPCLSQYPQIMAADSTMSIPHRMILSQQGKPFTKPDGRLMHGKLGKMAAQPRRNTNAIEFRRGYSKNGGNKTNASPAHSSPESSKPSTPASRSIPGQAKSRKQPDQRSSHSSPASSSQHSRNSPGQRSTAPSQPSSSATSSPGGYHSPQRPLPAIPGTSHGSHTPKPPKRLLPRKSTKRLPRSHLSQTDTLEGHAETLRRTCPDAVDSPGTEVDGHGERLASTASYASLGHEVGRQTVLGNRDPEDLHSDQSHSPSSASNNGSPYLSPHTATTPCSPPMDPRSRSQAHGDISHNQDPHDSPSPPHNPRAMHMSWRNAGSINMGNLNEANISSWTLQRHAKNKNLCTSSRPRSNSGSPRLAAAARNVISRQTIPRHQSHHTPKGSPASSPKGRTAMERTHLRFPAEQSADPASPSTSRDTGHTDIAKPFDPGCPERSSIRGKVKAWPPQDLPTVTVTAPTPKHTMAHREAGGSGGEGHPSSPPAPRPCQRSPSSCQDTRTSPPKYPLSTVPLRVQAAIASIEVMGCDSPSSESDYFPPPPPPPLVTVDPNAPSPSNLPSPTQLPSPVCKPWTPEQTSSTSSSSPTEGANVATTSFCEPTPQSHKPAPHLSPTPKYAHINRPQLRRVASKAKESNPCSPRQRDPSSSEDSPVLPPEESPEPAASAAATPAIWSPSMGRQRQPQHSLTPPLEDSDIGTEDRIPPIPPKLGIHEMLQAHPPTPPPPPSRPMRLLPADDVIDSLPKETMNLRKIKIEDLLAARKLKPPVPLPEAYDTVDLPPMSMTDTQSRRKRDQSAERLRKLVPQQAHLFNDMVSSELRQILSQRKTKKDPVEV